MKMVNAVHREHSLIAVNARLHPQSGVLRLGMVQPISTL